MSDHGAPGRWTKTDRVGIAVCVCLSVVLVLVGVRPWLAERARLREHRAALAEAREASQQRSQSLSEIRHQLVATQRRVAESPLRLEAVDRLNHRLSKITELASAHELEIDQLEPGQGEPSEHFVTVPIRVSGHGGYIEVSRFLDQLHQRMPDVAVAALELKKSAASAGTPQFRFDLLWYAAPQS